MNQAISETKTGGADKQLAYQPENNIHS